MASQSPDSSFIALRHHDEYHLSGGDLFFLVEQYHFRVHRYFFERESTFFKHQLATPASPGEERQGTSEGTAIVLDHVTPAEFARFLWVFYNPKYSLYDATVEDWAIILKLADRWSFPEVKNLAIRELEKHLMDDIERIVVYQKYNVDKRLLIPRYAALCARTETLSLSEGMRLGMETALNIARARECARSPSVGGLRSPTSVILPSEEMHGIIVDLFSILETSKGQENGSSTASSSTTGGSVIPSCPYMLPHTHNGILQETPHPRTPLTETPANPTENLPTATRTDEIPVPAVKGSGRTNIDSFEADEDEEYWDDSGSDSDTHVDSAGMDSEKVYGDVDDDSPVENVVDPQDNNDADLDEQVHDLTPDAGVGEGPLESSAQDHRDDNDAGASHEMDGEPDQNGLGDGEGDGHDDSSSPSSGEQRVDITLDAPSEPREGNEDDGGTPIGKSASSPNPDVDSSSSVPGTRTDIGHGSGFSFDFMEPSGPGPIPTFNFDSTLDHNEVPNITVQTPTASHASFAGTEAGDESDTEVHRDAKNASASSSSDIVLNSSGPEDATTTEVDTQIAEGSGDAVAEEDENSASNNDSLDNTLPPSHDTASKVEDGGSVAAEGNSDSTGGEPPTPEPNADEAADEREEDGTIAAEGNSDNSPAPPGPDSSVGDTTPKLEHGGEPSTVPVDEDAVLQHTATSGDEDAKTETKVPRNADTTAPCSDPPVDSSSTLPPLPPVDNLRPGGEPGRTRRPTLSIDTTKLWDSKSAHALGPMHAGHASGETGQPTNNPPEETHTASPINPPPITPANAEPLAGVANPLPVKPTLPEESESEDDPNEEFYDSPEGPAL